MLTLGGSEARVSLTFELDQSTYIATRVVRRNARGGVSTKEARLECLEESGTSTVLAGTEREINPAVESLLRLSFEDFTRCVALPQGEFARFLRAKGEERRDLLLRLLNLNVYLLVGQRAGQIAATANAAVQLKNQRLEVLAAATPEVLALATKRSTSLKQLHNQAQKARPKIEESHQLEVDERNREAEARRFIQLLQRITVPTRAREHAEQLSALQSEFRVAEAAAKTATQQREAAAASTKELPDLAALKTTVAAHGDLARCLVELATRDADFSIAKAHEEHADKELAEAEVAHQEAECRLQSLEIAHAAEHLAENLVAGEPCPVCDQVVQVLPSRHAPQALSGAKKVETDAKKKLESARKAQSDAAKATAALDGTLAALRQQRDGLEAQIKIHPELEDLNALIAAIEDKLAKLSAARAQEDAANANRTAKQEDLTTLATETEALQSLYDSQRDRVASLAPPSAQRRDLLADWEVLDTWAKSTVTEQQFIATTAGEKADECRVAAESQVETLLAACANLDVSVSGDIVDVLTAITEAATQVAAEVQGIKSAITEAKGLEQDIRDLREESEVAATLRGLLRADHFPEWLLTEALELLVIDASATLRALTNDEFSLTLGDKEFMVIDHANADEERPARTLSGVRHSKHPWPSHLLSPTRSAASPPTARRVLDSLFLDEGFGTLDAETLDTVAATIENLGQSGRMVGVITHVRELAARVPVRFEVRKGVRTSTVEKLTS